MERGSSAAQQMGGNGGGLLALALALPVGFRFRPTNEELLLHYLKPKTLSRLSFLASVNIPELDVLRLDPWVLPGDSKHEIRFYFWTAKEESKHTHFSKMITTTGSGFWCPIAKSKKIVSSNGNADVIGTRRQWGFYQKHYSGYGWLRTNWCIHEFRLPNQTLSTNLNSNGGMLRDWVVYKVFWKKTVVKKLGFTVSELCGLGVEMPTIIDLENDDNSDYDPPPEAYTSSTEE